VGPVLGGQLVDHFGWRSIFLVNLPIGVAGLIWGWLLLPRGERQEAAPPRPDAFGTVLLGAALICLLVPLTFASEWGWASPRTVTLLVLCAASLAAFVFTELHVKDPVLDLDLLLHNRLFASANLAALLNYMALYAISILTAVFLEVVQGRSAGITGWIMLGQPGVQALLSPLSGHLSDKVGSRLLSTSGMVIIAAGMVLLATMPSMAGIPRVVASLAVVGIGLAAFSAPNTSAIMGSVGRSQLSVASAFLGTMRVTGQALSVAVLGGIAAGKLGRLGGRFLYSHGHGAGGHALAALAASHYAEGYRMAMVTGAGLALVGALASLTRGAHAAQS
jgi:MFS family permease